MTTLAAPVDIASIAPAGARFEPAGAAGVARIVIDRPTDAVNAIDPPLIVALSVAVAAARAARPRGLVIASAKPDQFVGGADLTMLAGWSSAAEIGEASRAMHRLLDDLATLPCTTVAAINGSALGGGFELALACDYRIAADAPSVRVGLPEVQLGLLPAAGGTQRLPRLLGLPAALDLILNARRLSARRALRVGLVDEVVHPAALAKAAADRAATAPKRRPAGGRTPIERAATWLPPIRALVLRQARSRVVKETHGRYPAPFRAIDAIATGLARGMARGSAAEAASFGDLATSVVARNLIALFMLGLRQRRAASAGLPLEAAPREIAIVGAGLMGSGIAQAGAIGGMRVRIRDVDDAAVGRGLAAVRKLTQDAGRKGIVNRRESRRAIARVTGTTDLSGFHRADLVVEAVFEDLALKRRVLAEIEAVVRDDAVIASNTSALPIAEIARDARRPERVVGIHFFSPVHRMQLVEVVRPARADDAAVARVVATGQAMGKTVIVVRDGPGFYTTRSLGVMLGEATLLLEEGARIEDVDGAMVAFGWPLGPFALIDEVGLAVADHAGRTVAAARGLTVAPRAVRLLAEAGLQGKRGGAGFYRYDGKARTPNLRVYEVLASNAATRAPAPEDVGDRLSLLFLNEAARCLDEEVLRSAAEGDLGAVLGLGFPPFLGGPFRWADARGPELRDALRALAARHGERYAPAAGLLTGRPYYR
jgi:3-hydroxyacyl-CoA dehydrogenase / enoyl-CoA hydratase / 3-hydroxybutyryl-CoA epimerase